MGKPLQSFPSSFLEKMAKEDRPVGRAGWTTEEAQQKGARREELKEQKLFYSWLNLRGILFYNPRSDKASTIRAGAPDFTVFYQSKTLFLEFKSPGWKQSPAQIEFERDATQAGFTYLVVYSAQQAMEVCRSFFEIPRL